MYKEEKMKILQLLSDGHIDAKTAGNLLKALDEKHIETEVVVKKNNFKTLKIDILSGDGDDVKIRIPLEFAKVLKNKNFSSQINNSGANIDIDEIIELASSGIVGEIINITSADGDVIKVTIE